MDIVLIKPENPGNVGAIARVMKNFAFTNLIVINPQCDIHSEEAKNRAKHAQDVLKDAKIQETFDKSHYDLIIGTTGALGTDYNILRSPITPKELKTKLSGSSQKKTALLFGPEGYGLSNEELKNCDILVTIPSNPKYPTLNLSQSVAVILYELFDEDKSTVKKYVPASREDLEEIYKKMDAILDSMEFSTPEKRETQKTVWKRMFGKATLTRREAFAIMGLLKKLQK